MEILDNENFQEDIKDRVKQENEQTKNQFEIIDNKIIKYNGDGGGIIIPKSVTSIEPFAFHDCIKLTDITIPSGVINIGNLSFLGCKGLINLIIPNTVTIIGKSAFHYCISLESVTMPNSVRNIGSSAFAGCDKLKKVYYLGTMDDWVKIKFGNGDSNPINHGDVYINNEKVVNVNLKTATVINNYSFYNFKSLQHINMPNCLNYIGNSAFYGCDSLTDITIPNSVTDIGECLFNGCKNLTNVNMSNNITKIGNRTFWFCFKLTNFVIPSGVTDIGDKAFGFCMALTSISIPKGVTKIGEWAFYGCKNLKTIYYQGSESDRENIFIDENNEILKNATWIYNYKIKE